MFILPKTDFALLIAEIALHDAHFSITSKL